MGDQTTLINLWKILMDNTSFSYLIQHDSEVWMHHNILSYQQSTTFRTLSVKFWNFIDILSYSLFQWYLHSLLDSQDTEIVCQCAVKCIPDVILFCVAIFLLISLLLGNLRSFVYKFIIIESLLKVKLAWWVRYRVYCLAMRPLDFWQLSTRSS